MGNRRQADKWALATDDELADERMEVRRRQPRAGGRMCVGQARARRWALGLRLYSMKAWYGSTGNSYFLRRKIKVPDVLGDSSCTVYVVIEAEGGRSS